MPSSLARVFHANLTEHSGSDWMVEQLGLLDKASLSRAAEISHPQRRKQFLFGRVLLWHALRYSYGTDKLAGWRFEPGPGGKPLLLGPQGAAEVAVSLSHSHERVICALMECHSVGIDVELSKPRDFPALAKAVMTETEHRHFAGLEAPAQAAFFYRCWTAKEACAKAIGAHQAPAFKHMDTCRVEMSTNTKSVAYAGMSWENQGYVTSLACEGGASQVKIFKLGADGFFLVDLLAGASPFRITLPKEVRIR